MNAINLCPPISLLKLLFFLACATLIKASFVTKVASEITIFDLELLSNEHLNTVGLKKLVKKNVEHIILKNCSGVIDHKTFHAFPKFTRLTIYRSNIEGIHTTLPVNRLMVMGSHFPDLDEDLQRKLPKLQHALLLGNKNFRVEPQILRNFKKLTALYISEANFTEQCVTKEWFKGMDSLEELGLSDNGIECLAHDAFHSLRSLRKLDLTYNHISDLEKVIFKKLTKLEKLGLYHNDLEYINLNMFANQRNHLEVLGISWSTLRNSDISAQSLLKAFPKLQTVSFGHTDMPNDFKAGEFCQILRQNGASCDVDALFGASRLLGYSM